MGKTILVDNFMFIGGNIQTHYSDRGYLTTNLRGKAGQGLFLVPADGRSNAGHLQEERLRCSH